jgi:AraC-like DNA-binding protein
LGYCFIFLKQGHADFVCGPIARVLSTGDSVVLRQGSTASLRSHTSAGFTIFYFSFFPQSLDSLLTLGERKLMEVSERMGKSCATYYPSTSEFARLFGALVEQYPMPGTLAHACHMLQLVATLLTDKQGSPQIASPNEDGGKARVATIVGQLRGSELETISVEELARRCGCSRRHLGRVFREQFGNSVVSRKMELRLEKATRLLLSSSCKIIDVALECGFNHLGQFSAKFKEKYGATPAKWRQEQLKSSAGQLHLASTRRRSQRELGRPRPLNSAR